MIKGKHLLAGKCTTIWMQYIDENIENLPCIKRMLLIVHFVHYNI